MLTTEPPPPCSLDLVSILEELGLSSEAAGGLGASNAPELAAANSEGRVACLALLKRFGVTKLGDRQKIATAIAKVIKREAASAAEAAATQEQEAVDKARAKAKQEAEAAAAKAALPWGGMEIVPVDQLKPPPPRGSFVLEGTGRARLLPWVPAPAEDVAAAARDPKVAQPTPFKEHLQGKFRKQWEAAVDALYASGAGPVGHFYGLRFPFTLDMIEAGGAGWLTQALHAAGTLGADNAVTTMTVTPFVAGSMSLKCFLDVTYAHRFEGDGLHTSLFVKYPFRAVHEHEKKGAFITRCLMNNDGPELDFYRIVSAGAPIRSPRYYYGDICLETGTCLLITEKLELPPAHADFGPFEYEPIPYKSVDYVRSPLLAHTHKLDRCCYL